MDENEIPETLKDIGYFGLDFVPIVGEAKGIYETKKPLMKVTISAPGLVLLPQLWV